MLFSLPVHVYCWIQWSENFEYRSTFGEVTCKNRLSFVFDSRGTYLELKDVFKEVARLITHKITDDCASHDKCKLLLLFI